MALSRLVLLISAVAAAALAAGAIHVSKPAWYQRLWYPLRYEQIVQGHARNYRLDAALLSAVIYQESKFRADARSRSGAIGLMQLMPATARGIALRTGGTRFRVADLYDPELNVRYGAWYLRHLLDKYRNEELALAALQVTPHVDTLRADLEAIAAVGDDAVAAAAARLGHALSGTLGLRLLDVLQEAALEVSAQLPSGHVEVRLAGHEPQLVYVEEEGPAPAPTAPEDGLTARITLRLPDSLKAAVEAAAAREGLSVNAWLVRALARAVSAPAVRRVGSRLTGFGQS